MALTEPTEPPKNRKADTCRLSQSIPSGHIESREAINDMRLITEQNEETCVQGYLKFDSALPDDPEHFTEIGASAGIRSLHGFRCISSR